MNNTVNTKALYYENLIMVNNNNLQWAVSEKKWIS